MTHVGPGSSQTAIQQIDLDQDVIKAGCFVLDKIMREPELVRCFQLLMDLSYNKNSRKEYS